MTNKSYKNPEDTPMIVGETAVVYNKDVSTSGIWNPNVPFQGTHL
jgi:hypothetical protein